MPVDLVGTLHTYVGRVRKMLTNADGIATLSTRSGAFRLEAEPNLVDYHVFRATAEEARIALSRGDPRLALAKASAAIGLWQQEEPMAGLSSTKVDNWRRRVIADEWVPAQDTLLQALLGLGEFGKAQVRLNDLQRDHPDQPAFIKRRVQTLHALGRVEEATRYHLAQYKALRERGDDAAAEELTQLHQQALTRPTLAVPEARNPPPQQQSPSPPPTPTPRPLRHRLPPDIPTFVGRETYLAKLDALTEAGARPGLVVLDGQGGVGKTALALRWAHRLDKPESTFYYDLHGVGPGPRNEADEVVGELLAAFDYPVERLATPTRRQHKLNELLAERPLVIILDNVQNSGHVRALLPLLADCIILLTSRQRLTGLRTLYHAIPLPITPLATHQGEPAHPATGPPSHGRAAGRHRSRPAQWRPADGVAGDRAPRRTSSARAVRRDHRRFDRRHHPARHRRGRRHPGREPARDVRAVLRHPLTVRTGPVRHARTASRPRHQPARGGRTRRPAVPNRPQRTGNAGRCARSSRLPASAGIASTTCCARSARSWRWRGARNATTARSCGCSAGPAQQFSSQ